MKSSSHPATLIVILAVAVWFAPACEQQAIPDPKLMPTASEAPTSDGNDEQPDTVEQHPPNHLAAETSPYLLMHAHNPVDWFPWSEEALEKAKDGKKLIFLSIGYSSCYWCHVMERESFMDDEIAAFLNKHFVCIKVDREERPDIDDIYMTAVQVVARHGGWPLSAFLTPDAKPFYGGTYFPARTGDRGTRVGFLELIAKINEMWQRDPDSVRTGADQLTRIVRQVLREQVADLKLELTVDLLVNTQSALTESFDPEWGGFGYDELNPQRPKFPSPPDLLYLIDRARSDPDNVEAREMLSLTLRKMAEGGIRDHLGGGFHRYSTDRFWHIPHFEKMLYDNGQLASVYAEAYRLLGNEAFRRVVVELLEFVTREMTDESGAFYSAIDAETDAEEGKFYRWTRDEIDQLLIEDRDVSLSAMYNLQGDPNFEHEYFVPLLTRAKAEIAQERRVSESELESQLSTIRARLLAERSKRKRPITDTKILTSWNGLMIRGFADAGRILEKPQYTTAAVRAAEFVLYKLRTDDGRLLRTYRAGQAKLNAYLVDYAFLIDGLIALHRATEDPRWLNEADKLMQKQIELFWDEDEAGFFFTSEDHETLIARPKKRTDSVLPSGNAVSASNLVYLAHARSNAAYRRYAQTMLKAFAPGLADARHAGNMPRMAVAVSAYLYSAEED